MTVNPPRPLYKNLTGYCRVSFGSHRFCNRTSLAFQKPLIQEISEPIFSVPVFNISILGQPVTLQAGAFRYFQVPRLKRTVNQLRNTKSGNCFVSPLRICHRIFHNSVLDFYLILPRVRMTSDGFMASKPHTPESKGVTSPGESRTPKNLHDLTLHFVKRSFLLILNARFYDSFLSRMPFDCWYAVPLI
jgi:hypothetical protein